MRQSDLNRAVAESLGESVNTVASRGFSLLSDAFEEREPLVVDFDDPAHPVTLSFVESAA